LNHSFKTGWSRKPHVARRFTLCRTRSVRLSQTSPLSNRVSGGSEQKRR
jgi:hypothetical protein